MINVGDLYYKYDWGGGFSIWIVIRKTTYSASWGIEHVMYNFMTGRTTDRISQSIIEQNFRRIS